MLVETTDARTLTDLIAVIGSAGTTMGGAVGALIGRATWRQRFEYLALGAAAGSVAGCFVAFALYDGVRILGW